MKKKSASKTLRKREKDKHLETTISGMQFDDYIETEKERAKANKTE